MSLKISALSLRLGRHSILENVAIELHPGAIVCVLGPNGAGKSSLLRTATGEWVASSGEVKLDDRAIDEWPARERAQHLAVLPQHSNLDFAFKVEEVVLLGRTPHASGWQRNLAIAHSALELVDAIDLVDRLYTELSGGEKQRVQLARVLAQVWEPAQNGARYLLLDEPTAAFDLAHQKMMAEILSRVAGDGVGILIVLHDLNMAAKLADLIVMIKDGRICASGRPDTVITADIIKDVFDVDVVVNKHPLSDSPVVIL